MLIDNNILFSLMKPDSSASGIFELGALKFVAPGFIKSELDEHEKECQSKSGLSKKGFAHRRAEVEARITFGGVEFYGRFLKDALKTVFDPDDAPYIALALALRAPIWSNDAGLKKQSLVAVFSTKDLIELLPE